MNNCDHDFHTIQHGLDIDDTARPAVVVCAYCGQVRHLTLGGRVTIVKQKGDVKTIVDHE